MQTFDQQVNNSTNPSSLLKREKPYKSESDPIVKTGERMVKSNEAEFLIDLSVLMMKLDLCKNDPSDMHHSDAKKSIDKFLCCVFNEHLEVLELMENLNPRMRDNMQYKIAGCAMLLIASASPVTGEQTPILLMMVYKSIQRGLFYVLAIVFGIDTGAILGVLRSSRTGNKKKVEVLAKYFHVDHRHDAHEILSSFFCRIVGYSSESRDDIVNWIITVLYVDHMAPVFDSKYPGIIRADKYYKLYAKGSPHMSYKDELATVALLKHLGDYCSSVTDDHFNIAWIIEQMEVPPMIAINVAKTILKFTKENDASMDYYNDPSREQMWHYVIKNIDDTFKDPKFMRYIHPRDAKVKTLSTVPSSGHQPTSIHSNFVHPLIKKSPFFQLTKSDKERIMKSPVRDIFRCIQDGDHVDISIFHQRMIIACVLGDFEEKIDNNRGFYKNDNHEKQKMSLADYLASTTHHTTLINPGGVICPRGNLCLINGFIQDGLKRKYETCYDPQHKYRISNLLKDWKYLCHYFSFINDSTEEKHESQKKMLDRNKQFPDLPSIIVPAWFVVPELWMKIFRKINQEEKFGDKDFDFSNNPMSQENSQLLQLVHLTNLAGTKMFNRWKSRVKSKRDFSEFRDLIFSSPDEFQELRTEFDCTENTYRQFGVYITWYHALMKVGRDRIVKVGIHSIEVDIKSVEFAKEYTKYGDLLRWIVTRRNLLPTFTYLDEKSGKYSSHSRHLTRIEILQLQDYIYYSRRVCEYTEDEERVLSYGGKIQYERYDYHQLHSKRKEGVLSPGQVAKDIQDMNRWEVQRLNTEFTEIKSKYRMDTHLFTKSLIISKSTQSPILNSEYDGKVSSLPVDPCTLITAHGGKVQIDKLNNIFHKHQNPLINFQVPVHNMFLGHVLPAPGFLLTEGPDFIVRDIRDFKVSGHKLLVLLATGKSIKTGGIHIACSGPYIQFDTIGNEQVTYQVRWQAVRGFATISYPDLAVYCAYESQQWCYMKNGGKLCIKSHKFQDGKDLVI